MPGPPTWIRFLGWLWLLTQPVLGLGLSAPETVSVGDSVVLKIEDLKSEGLLCVNSDFHTQTKIIPAGSKQTTLSVSQSGQLRISLFAGQANSTLERSVKTQLPVLGDRLELSPKSESVVQGKVQVLRWAWDKYFNALSLPSKLECAFPENVRRVTMPRGRLLSSVQLETSEKTGIVTVKSQDESVTFRQVSGPPLPFGLNREGQVLHTDSLRDQFGNLVDDGVAGTCTTFQEEEVRSVLQSQVLNGRISFPLDTKDEGRLKVEVLGQVVWLGQNFEK